VADVQDAPPENWGKAVTCMNFENEACNCSWLIGLEGRGRYPGAL
jgi:hypothetical protein